MNAHLSGLKLRALVREHMAGRRHADDSGTNVVADIGGAVDIGIGVALTCGGEAWVLAADRHERSLGVGLSWMQRAGARRLHLVTEECTGTLARRSSQFSADVSVWGLDETSLVSAVPQDHRPEVEPLPAHLELASMIVDGGADVVVEHGVVSGEVLGLEVCRIVDDEYSGQPRLEVGVGAHDREAFALMHGHAPVEESLARIVEVVEHHRRAGADPHPLNRLAPERALRHRIVAEPSVIGLEHLRCVSSVAARANVKDSVPCAAVGSNRQGERVVAVFSTGIDLDVVPVAADIRSWLETFLFEDGDARLAIVVPTRDASPVTKKLASLLRRPADVVGVELR